MHTFFLFYSIKMSMKCYIRHQNYALQIVFDLASQKGVVGENLAQTILFIKTGGWKVCFSASVFGFAIWITALTSVYKVTFFSLQNYYNYFWVFAFTLSPFQICLVVLFKLFLLNCGIPPSRETEIGFQLLYFGICVFCVQSSGRERIYKERE